MTPVHQTIFRVPGGNCFQACVASIFDLQLEEVPYFLDGAAGDSRWTQEQWDSVRSFARLHGRAALWVDNETEPDAALRLASSDLYYIATGPGPHPDFGHCVVMHKGQNIHDPMPSGSFLSAEPWLYIFFPGVSS